MSRVSRFLRMIFFPQNLPHGLIYHLSCRVADHPKTWSVPSLKLTANALEHRPKPKRKGERLPTIHFSRGKKIVRFMECILKKRYRSGQRCYAYPKDKSTCRGVGIDGSRGWRFWRNFGLAWLFGLFWTTNIIGFLRGEVSKGKPWGFREGWGALGNNY